MILTCHTCPRQLSCAGRRRSMARIAALFGWRAFGGSFRCGACHEAAS